MRRAQPTVNVILGPTNTGKTHHGLERMLSHTSGVMGFPLRLLAREAFDRVVEKVGAENAQLLTGEERIGRDDAPYVCATTEAMPMERTFAFVGVDEIQLTADRARGHIFTERLLNLRGSEETLFLGADTMQQIVDELLPSSSDRARPRLSSLTYTGAKKLARLPLRTAVVAFRIEDVYAIAEHLRREKGGAAVVMGALSPRTRNAQVALYQRGEVDYLVATDAIGMGLNLDVHHVAFAAREKFDGARVRDLTVAELAQIAGRAGRARRDGTFGTTLDCPAFSDDTVRAIEGHRFHRVEEIQWRNHALDFSSVDALLASLERPSPHRRLARTHDALDHTTLRALAQDRDVVRLVDDAKSVERLWACCQIPDFRDVVEDAHRQLVLQIFRFLSEGDGKIPRAFLERSLSHLDDATGDVDTLTTRISHVRTWSYVAHRDHWIKDASAFAAKTRVVEDRLSDALHEALTSRFVDTMTHVLSRRTEDEIAQKMRVDAAGELTVDGKSLGDIHGLSVRLAEVPRTESSGARTRLLQAASKHALKARAEEVLAAKDAAFSVDGAFVMWGDARIAELTKGPQPLKMDVRVTASDLETAVRIKIEARLRTFVREMLSQHFGALLDDDVSPQARALLYQLFVARGTLLRRDVDDVVKRLSKADRQTIRARGVQLGALTVDVLALHKPRALSFRRALSVVDDNVEVPPLEGKESSVDVDSAFDDAAYRALGYIVAGARAFRADLLERVLVKVERAANSHGSHRPSASTTTGAPVAPSASVVVDAANANEVAQPSARAGHGFSLDHAWLEQLGCSRDALVGALALVGFVVDEDDNITRPRRRASRGQARSGGRREDGSPPRRTRGRRE